MLVKGKIFHITPVSGEGKWEVKKENAETSKIYGSLEEAVIKATKKAEKVEQGHVVIHNVLP